MGCYTPYQADCLDLHPAERFAAVGAERMPVAGSVLMRPVFAAAVAVASAVGSVLAQPVFAAVAAEWRSVAGSVLVQSVFAAGPVLRLLHTSSSALGKSYQIFSYHHFPWLFML